MADANNGVRIEVEGLKETVRALRKLGDTDTPKAIRKVNKEAAEMVVREALPNTPVGSGRDPHPGRLKTTVKALAGERDASVKAGSPAKAPYARAIHWGVIGGPGRGPHRIRGTMFLFNAAQAVRSRVLDAYESAIESLLQDWR